MHRTNGPRSASARAVSAARRVLAGKATPARAAADFSVSVTLVYQAAKVIAEDPHRANSIARGNGSVTAARVLATGARGVSVKLTPALYDRLREIADAAGGSISEHASIAIAAYLARQEAAPPAAPPEENV